MNTGTDIMWAGQKVLKNTQGEFSFPFMILGTGRQIYVWLESHKAYLKLDIEADSKGEAMSKLADFIGVPLADFGYVADFPGPSDPNQKGIDDSVLKEKVGMIIPVGPNRQALPQARPETKVLKPEISQEGKVLPASGRPCSLSLI